MNSTAGDRAGSWRARLPVMLAVAASFFVYAAVRAPVPGVNEPHYLTKARHFWSPEWCAGDFFLESADTHRVFYAVLGPIAANLPLPAAAWIGRILAHLLLAFGWTELLARVVPGRWTPLWAAWLWLGLAAVRNLSGEWVVGGVEAKVFAYGLGFLGVAWWSDRRWIPAAIALGLAIAWHPLVGGWTCVAIGIGGTMVWLRDRFRSREETAEPVSLLPSPFEGVVSAGLLVLCALPGVWPALELFDAADDRPMEAPWTQPEDDLSVLADFIQVKHRLAHHLDPLTFGEGNAAPDDDHRLLLWSSYAALLVAWLLLRRRLPRTRAEREFAGFVLGTVVIAMIGLAIAIRTQSWLEMPWEAMAWRVSLLKFYWFRLADVVVPMAFATTVAGLLAGRRPSEEPAASSDDPMAILKEPLSEIADQIDRELAEETVTSSRRRIAWVVCGLSFAWTLCFPNASGVNTDLTAEEQRQWRAMCAWVRENTPPDVRFRTPHSGIAFKWYAQRPEFLAGKDCPQDAAGIVEWNERSNWFAAWAAEKYADQRYSEAEIREVSRAMNVDYFLCWHLGPVDMEPLHQVGDFRIYDVRPE